MLTVFMWLSMSTQIRDDNVVISYMEKHCKKVQADNDQEMVQSERNSHSTNQGVGKNEMKTYCFDTILTCCLPLLRKSDELRMRVFINIYTYKSSFDLWLYLDFEKSQLG